MALIILKVKFEGNLIFIPLVIFRNCSEELITRYCAGGDMFFPNTIETKKINAFLSIDSIYEFIERYDFKVTETRFVDVDIDIIEEWISNIGKKIEGDNTINFFGIISSFYFFLQTNVIDYDRLKLLQKLCKYKQEKEVYDEFIDNCKEGLYSSEDLESIEHNCPNRTEYDLSLQDPCLKNELQYLIGLFKTILFIHSEDKAARRAEKR